jgi:hypothetical protein
MLGVRSSSPEIPKGTKAIEGEMGLGTLPYDLLLNIATYLDLRDVHALHLVSFYDFYAENLEWHRC